MGATVPFERDGVRLAAHDFGGDGPAVLLLHGLAGYAGEWGETAAWLTRRARVVALEARGHGRSERHPPDVSPEAHVADAAMVIDRLELARCVVVGQSLGGVVALRLAAGHPQAVRGLVLVEAGPEGGGPGVDDKVAAVDASLRRWPVPFGSRASAVDFFGGDTGPARVWADGLEERDGGLWPCFDPAVLVRTLREAISRPAWEPWRQLECPVLVVRGGEGTLSVQEARSMLACHGAATLVEVADAGHDVHLERPAAWRAALSAYLDELDAAPAA